MGKRSLQGCALNVTVLVLSGFLILALYIIVLSTIYADGLKANNHRVEVSETGAARGTIFSADGQELAVSRDGKRLYPFGEVMASVIGFVSRDVGSYGLEAYANRDLLGRTDDMERMGPLAQLFSDNQGNDLHLTIDAGCQQAAFTALAGRRGAAVVLDATTGAVIALVSSPVFDPNTVEEDWAGLNARVDAPLLNRVTQGLYPPGSTIKPLIADAALSDEVTGLQEVFNCEGVLGVGGGYTIKESHDAVHGRVNLEKALVESCNVTFGTLGMRLGREGLAKAYDRFGFNKAAAGEIGEVPCHLPEFDMLDQGDQAQLGIGQSMLLVTPLHMALLASAFANGGLVMEPYMIAEVTNPNGAKVRVHQPKEWFRATEIERAKQIDGFMEKVVTEGTGTLAAVKNVRVTGKTGTAENPAGEDHAWFIGTATVNSQKVALAVIVENSGSGATVAAPVAHSIILSLIK